MISDYALLAYRSARNRKLRSWLTMIGIFVGIAAIVSLVSLSQGLQNAIAEQFVQLGSDKIIVQAAGSVFGPPGTAVSVPLTINDKELISKIKGIDLVVGRLIRIAKLEFEDEVRFSFIVSMPDENEEEIRLVIEANNYNVKQGRLLKKGDQNKVMVGSDLSEDFFEEPIRLREKIKIQDKSFEVIGILKKSGNPQQDSTLVISENSLREILNIEDEYDIIPARIEIGQTIPTVSERVRAKLRKSRGVEEGKEDFTVQTPDDILGTLNTILLIVQGVLVGIAAISLFVGGIGIANTMYTSVTERTKEIGIMKAVGARNKQILFLFLIESGFLGFFGGLIGVSLGIGISKFIELIAFKIYGSLLIQADFNLLFIFIILLFSFLVGSFSGVFPAKQASKLKPIEALKK